MAISKGTKLAITEDLRRGMRGIDVARKYGVSAGTVSSLRKHAGLPSAYSGEGGGAEEEKKRRLIGSWNWEWVGE